MRQRQSHQGLPLQLLPLQQALMVVSPLPSRCHPLEPAIPPLFSNNRAPSQHPPVLWHRPPHPNENAVRSADVLVGTPWLISDLPPTVVAVVDCLCVGRWSYHSIIFVDPKSPPPPTPNRHPLIIIASATTVIAAININFISSLLFLIEVRFMFPIHLIAIPLCLPQ